MTSRTQRHPVASWETEGGVGAPGGTMQFEANPMLQIKARAGFDLPKLPFNSARPLPFHYDRRRAAPVGTVGNHVEAISPAVRPLEAAIERAANDKAAKPPMTMSFSIMSLVAIFLAVMIGFVALVQNRPAAAVIFGIIDHIATTEPISGPIMTGDRGHPARPADRGAVAAPKKSK